MTNNTQRDPLDTTAYIWAQLFAQSSVAATVRANVRTAATEALAKPVEGDKEEEA